MRQHIVIVVGSVIVMSCNPITVPEDSHGVTGLIVERDRPTSYSSDLPTIWVKETEESECGVILMIRDETKLFRRDALGRTRSIDEGALAVGSRVRVQVGDGLIMDSCPGQATAESIELMPTSLLGS